jgi:hypothetical protein
VSLVIVHADGHAFPIGRIGHLADEFDPGKPSRDLIQRGALLG